MCEVFFTPGAVKRSVHSALRDSLIGHCLLMKKSVGHRSFIMVWTDTEPGSEKKISFYNEESSDTTPVTATSTTTATNITKHYSFTTVTTTI